MFIEWSGSFCEFVNSYHMQCWGTIPYITIQKKHTSRKKFTEEEDKRLKELAETYGAKKWDLIAEQMPGRNGRQCRDRYRNYLVPGFFNGQWQQSEDDLLKKLYEEIGPQWAKMMKYFNGRSSNSLKNRWNYFVCRLDKENDDDEKESEEPEKKLVFPSLDELVNNEQPRQNSPNHYESP